MTVRGETIAHYDALVAENNDPVRDPAPLRAYMERWDGAPFREMLALSPEKDVLEIGVGTGRLAVQTAPLCRTFWGIDFSPESIRRAAENLAGISNVHLLCGDFMTASFDCLFDVVYSSLTFLHIEDKLVAIRKAAALLKPQGRFVLSTNKNPSDTLVCGERKITLYPDNPDETAGYIRAARLRLEECRETEAAYLFLAVKM